MPLKKLMIIEDDRTTREALQRLFISRGWEVVMVTTQAEGLRLLDDYEPDWIVASWEQLEGTGERFLGALQSRRQRPRVALLTDPMDATRSALTSRLKTDARFCKPVLPEQVYRSCDTGWDGEPRLPLGTQVPTQRPRALAR